MDTRKLLIDTDTGSDDAVALLMALKSRDVEVVAVTTVCGNVPLELATKNALATIEVAETYAPPVYVGARQPLVRALVTAESVHGDDGMGDCGLIHPQLKPETDMDAVDAIIENAKRYENELEIVTIGPVTNLALAIMKAPDVMRKVKCVWTMGTSGYGYGNTTPVAEFNVYVDAEAYSVMMNAGIPLYVAGFDTCLPCAFYKEDMDALVASKKRAAVFSVECNRSLLQYNLDRSGDYMVDLPDAVAMSAVLWPDTVKRWIPSFGYVCVHEEAAYGQVIFDNGDVFAISREFGGKTPNCNVIGEMDADLFKRRTVALLTQ